MLGCNLDPLPAELLSAMLAGLLTSGTHDAASTSAIASLAVRAAELVDDPVEREALAEVATLARRAHGISVVV
jgi:hypothetical protein